MRLSDLGGQGSTLPHYIPQQQRKTHCIMEVGGTADKVKWVRHVCGSGEMVTFHR
jgi:hypothetical protein